MPRLPPDAHRPWSDGAEPRPPLIGDATSEVVVVGAGIAGLTTAVLLARAGVQVRVLESGTVGQGTTGASTAKVTVLQATRLSAIRRAHGDEAVVGYVEAQLAGQRWIRGQVAEPVDWVPEIRDAVTYTTEDDHIADIEAEAEAALAAGLPVDLADGVPELPFPVRRSIRLADQLQIDPRAWAAHLARELDRSPVATIHEHTRVVNIDPRGRSVSTEGGVVHAGQVVLSTLLPISDRGAFFARLEPVMSHGIAVTLADGAAPPIPMSYGVGDATRSLRDADVDGGRVLLVGGGGHVVGREPRALDRPAELLRWADAWFGVDRVTHRWCAHDLRPIDELPYAGRSDRLPGAPWVATGFAKWGMTNGTAAALTIAGRILGSEPQLWDALFDPQRHHRLPGFKEAARLNATVARELAWGWVRPGASTTADGPPVGRRRVVPCAAAASTAAADGEERCRLSLVCTHLGGVVRWNSAERTWDCPLHGSRFDQDGEVVAGPATRALGRQEPPGDP